MKATLVVSCYKIWKSNRNNSRLTSWTSIMTSNCLTPTKRIWIHTKIRQKHICRTNKHICWIKKWALHLLIRSAVKVMKVSNPLSFNHHLNAWVQESFFWMKLKNKIWRHSKLTCKRSRLRGIRHRHLQRLRFTLLN